MDRKQTNKNKWRASKHTRKTKKGIEYRGLVLEPACLVNVLISWHAALVSRSTNYSPCSRACRTSRAPCAPTSFFISISIFLFNFPSFPFHSIFFYFIPLHSIPSYSLPCSLPASVVLFAVVFSTGSVYKVYIPIPRSSVSRLSLSDVSSRMPRSRDSKAKALTPPTLRSVHCVLVSFFIFQFEIKTKRKSKTKTKNKFKKQKRKKNKK